MILRSGCGRVSRAPCTREDRNCFADWASLPPRWCRSRSHRSGRFRPRRRGFGRSTSFLRRDRGRRWPWMRPRGDDCRRPGMASRSARAIRFAGDWSLPARDCVCSARSPFRGRIAPRGFSDVFRIRHASTWSRPSEHGGADSRCRRRSRVRGATSSSRRTRRRAVAFPDCGTRPIWCFGPISLDSTRPRSRRSPDGCEPRSSIEFSR